MFCITFTAYYNVYSHTIKGKYRVDYIFLSIILYMGNGNVENLEGNNNVCNWSSGYIYSFNIYSLTNLS